MSVDVGSVRPTQLIYTYGVGAAVDLPQFSAMVMGLDDWPDAQMEAIREDRLLRVVRHVLGPQVRQLKARRSAAMNRRRVTGRKRCGRSGGCISALAGLHAMPTAGANPVGVVRVPCRPGAAGAFVLPS